MAYSNNTPKVGTIYYDTVYKEYGIVLSTDIEHEIVTIKWIPIKGTETFERIDHKFPIDYLDSHMCVILT